MITNELKVKADELGRVLADKAALVEREKELKAELKASGERKINGFMFTVNVVHKVRKTLDMKAVRAKLSRQFIKAHTRETPTVSIEVRARNNEEVKAA